MLQLAVERVSTLLLFCCFVVLLFCCFFGAPAARVLVPVLPDVSTRTAVHHVVYVAPIFFVVGTRTTRTLCRLRGTFLVYPYTMSVTWYIFCVPVHYVL